MPDPPGPHAHPADCGARQAACAGLSRHRFTSHGHAKGARRSRIGRVMAWDQVRWSPEGGGDGCGGDGEQLPDLERPVQ